MKPEHNDVIEARAEAFWNAGARSRPWSALTDDDRSLIKRRLVASDRAAAEQGYRLAKLPERIERSIHGLRTGETHRKGWNACLDAIETITLEKSE